jgi:hypothetical protein
MTEQPKRDLDIVVGESDALQSDNDEDDLALDYSGGVELGTVWYVTADGDGDGSREDPLNISEIAGEYYVDAAKIVDKNLPDENDVIILLGDDGVMEVGAINLMPGQKLLSPSGYITVAADAEGSRKTQFRPEGKRAELEFENNVPLTIQEIEINGSPEYLNLITLADNTAVSGLKINDPGYYGNIIYGDGVSGEINITNNIIAIGEDRIEAGNSIYISARPDENGNTNINIIGNDISTYREGISVETRSFAPKSISGLAEIEPRSFENLNINISNNKINKIINYGIHVENYGYKNSTINVKDNDIKDVISAVFDPRLESSYISPYESTGIYLDNRDGESLNVNINNNNIENVISFDGNSSGIEVNNDGFKQINNTITNNSTKVLLAERGFTQGISVYNMVNRDGNTKTTLQDNIVSKLHGDNMILNSISPSVSNLRGNSGLYVANMGSEANLAETIVKSNNISDNYGGFINFGIMVDNNGDLLNVDSVEAERSIYNFEESITEISNNNIKNSLTYEAAFGIGISEYNSLKINTTDSTTKRLKIIVTKP